MKRIAVAAISARALAQQAAHEGFEVIALDCFGDRDTRQAAAQWHPIGDAHTLRIDAARLLAALDAIARSGAAEAWIVGSGFDGRPDLLGSGAKRLPFVGNGAGIVRRVRDTRAFFGTLRAHGIDHPAVRFALPEDPRGWLVKDSAGCGGTHVRRAAPGLVLGPSQYLQREAPGTPQSATFIADGARAAVLGCNEIIVNAAGDLPYLYSGVVGPLPPDARLRDQVQAALAVLVPAFGVRGLGSLDFMFHGGQISVLELNPRPSASLMLYPQAAPLRSHLRACVDGVLPTPPKPEATSPTSATRGQRVVYARQAIAIDARAGDWLAAQPDARDLPHAPTHVACGQPLCSVEVEGAGVAVVHQRLAARRHALLASLEAVR